MKKQIFKVGDKVFDIRYGWGIVEYLYTIDWEKAGPEFLVCKVDFNNEEEPYIYTKKSATQMLSFTEYTLQGFSQERAINYEEYIGKWGKFWDVTKHSGIQNMVIGHLSDYNENDIEGFPFACEETGGYYTNFEPLTKEQIKILGL